VLIRWVGTKTYRKKEAKLLATPLESLASNRIEVCFRGSGQGQPKRTTTPASLGDCLGFDSFFFVEIYCVITLPIASSRYFWIFRSIIVVELTFLTALSHPK